MKTRDQQAYPLQTEDEGYQTGFTKLEAVALAVLAGLRARPQIELDWQQQCACAFDIAEDFCAEADRRKEGGK